VSGRFSESQVLQLPPGAVRLASSPTAENDMWGAADERVLAVQGHPEMACATALDKILPAVSRSGPMCWLTLAGHQS
jgi:GMP synthase-like glutamine amidotransferase